MAETIRQGPEGEGEKGWCHGCCLPAVSTLLPAGLHGVLAGSGELAVQIPVGRALPGVSNEGLRSPVLQQISATYKVIIMEAKLGGSFL